MNSLGLLPRRLRHKAETTPSTNQTNQLACFPNHSTKRSAFVHHETSKQKHDIPYWQRRNGLRWKLQWQRRHGRRLVFSNPGFDESSLAYYTKAKTSSNLRWERFLLSQDDGHGRAKWRAHSILAYRNSVLFRCVIRHVLLRFWDRGRRQWNSQFQYCFKSSDKQG